MSGLSPVQARDFSRFGQKLMVKIEQLGKPVIAMINGFAFGGGMELAMACHLRVASASAKLGQPEINLGLIPGFGGSQRLLRLAGRGVALELCLLGQPIDATRALALNIVTRVVPGAELETETMKLAEQLASSVRRLASRRSRSACLRSLMSVITVTVPPPATRLRRIWYQRPSGAWSSIRAIARETDDDVSTSAPCNPSAYFKSSHAS